MNEADPIRDQIITGSRKSNKSYAFDESHDPDIPADIWFQESHEGQVLFVVFYTQACRWSRCVGCNLPARMSPDHISYRHLMAQTDHIFRNSRVRPHLKSIRKMIISNNGSILDQATFSSTALMYLLAQTNIHLPSLEVFSIETRPEYVDFSEMEFISRALSEGETPTSLEIAIGFEAFDDHIRNTLFDKGLSLAVFENLVRNAASFNHRLKCYFMLKPVPEITDREAIEDIRNAIDYLDGISRQYRIIINMHLNPTFVAAGTILAERFRDGRYSPPNLLDVVEAVRNARGKNITVFIGLSDEGQAVPGGSFIRPGDDLRIRNLELFNRTQNFDILDQIH